MRRVPLDLREEPAFFCLMQISVQHVLLQTSKQGGAYGAAIEIIRIRLLSPSLHWRAAARDPLLYSTALPRSNTPRSSRALPVNSRVCGVGIACSAVNCANRHLSQQVSIVFASGIGCNAPRRAKRVACGHRMRRRGPRLPVEKVQLFQQTA
jgi:hypothetical protein